MIGRGIYITVREMRAIERNSEALGFNEELMMENAGSWVARIASVVGDSFLVIAGKGGKGGDGLVAARHLALMGKDVSIYLPYKLQELKEITRKNLERAISSGAKLVKWPEKKDVIIDALLGTGIRGRPRGIAEELIKWMNDVDSYVISIDVPSGMDPDTGSCELCVEPDLVITVHKPKMGLERIKDIVMSVEIGIPKRAENYLGPGDLELMPRGERKGKNGRVAVLGGSELYQGAPWLSALAAFRAGADLVYVYTPNRMDYPELIWRPQKDILESFEKDKIDVIVSGPGLNGSMNLTQYALEYFKKNKDVKMVLDADSLKYLANLEVDLEGRAVLTPHLGEASKLLGEKIEDDVDSRVGAAERIAEKYNACVILKGKVDVVSCQGKSLLNDAGTNFMTVGGTGDVLAGVVGAFLARDEPWWASKAATYAVTKAGEACFEERGHSSPTCIIEEVPKLMRSISS